MSSGGSKSKIRMSSRTRKSPRRSIDEEQEQEQEQQDRGDSDEEGADPFDEVAQYLKRSGGRSFGDYTVAEIRRTLAKIASAQSALKTMDGATHHFVNAFKEASSLAARHDKFVSSDSPKMKEAAKLYEYVTTVERAMQAAEICQAVQSGDAGERAARLREAGLVELRRVPLVHNKLACTLSVLAQANTTAAAVVGAGGDKRSERKRSSVPGRFLPGELVLAVTQDTTQGAAACVSQSLRVMREKAQTVTLKSVGFVEEEVSLQPTVLRMALAGLEGVGEFLLPGDMGGRHEPGGAAAVALVAAGTQEPGSTSGKNESAAASELGRQRPPAFTSVRVVGYSAGAAVGAYMAMILDGSLQSPHKALRNSTRFAGLLNKKVRCVALGSPPCLSRSLVPKFVTSVLCGDDVVPRASPESIAHLKERALKALQSGAGKGGFSSFGLTSWVGDMTAVAGKSLALYSGGQHDLSALSVPGRVFYCKSRSLQNGASIQRVMRGNWKEDVLWLLHEILLSDKMIAHHSLEYYIKTLSRL